MGGSSLPTVPFLDTIPEGEAERKILPVDPKYTAFLGRSAAANPTELSSRAWKLKDKVRTLHKDFHWTYDQLKEACITMQATLTGDFELDEVIAFESLALSLVDGMDRVYLRGELLYKEIGIWQMTSVDFKKRLNQAGTARSVYKLRDGLNKTLLDIQFHQGWNLTEELKFKMCSSIVEDWMDIRGGVKAKIANIKKRWVLAKVRPQLEAESCSETEREDSDIDSH